MGNEYKVQRSSHLGDNKDREPAFRVNKYASRPATRSYALRDAAVVRVDSREMGLLAGSQESQASPSARCPFSGWCDKSKAA